MSERGKYEEVGGIAPRRIWRCKCATCGTAIDVVGPKFKVPRLLRNRDWSRSGELWYCPKHGERDDNGTQ